MGKVSLTEAGYERREAMIRHACTADVECIALVYNEAILEGGLTGHLEPLSLQNRRSWFLKHQDPYAIFVKIADSSVVGYAAISPYREGREAFDKTCEISCYLSSEYRDRGFGKELIQHGIEHAVRTGFRIVTAIVLGGNSRSLGLLGKLGFSIFGRLPDAASIRGSYSDHVYLSRLLRCT